MAVEQFRVAWPDRAAYLAVLKDLEHAIGREKDAVQVGAPETDRLARAMNDAWEARVRYRCQVQEMRAKHPPRVVE